MMIISRVMIVWHRLVLAETEVATATTTAAAIAPGCYAANNETSLRNKENVYISWKNGWDFITDWFTLQAGDVTTKYAFTFSSPNCSAM